MKADIKKIEDIMAKKCLHKQTVAQRAGWASGATVTGWFGKIRKGWDLEPVTIGKLARGLGCLPTDIELVED